MIQSSKLSCLYGRRSGTLPLVRDRSWDIVECLRESRSEIEDVVLRGIRAVPDPVAEGDAEYFAGQHTKVVAFLDYALAGIEQDGECPEPIPSPVLAQARRAARLGVRQQMLLRRCLTGHVLLDEFVMDAAKHAGLPGHGDALRRIRTTRASLLERLIASVTDEYTREAQRARSSPEERRGERVRKALAGEHFDAGDLGYDLEASHVGAIAKGPEAGHAVRDLAARLARPELCVPMGLETVWAWLGGQRPLPFAHIERALSAGGFKRVALAIGEPGRGIEGFRLTHRQAQAALLVALRRPRRLTRYADVALVAPFLKDERMARSFVGIHLSPLDLGRDDSALRETLSAYAAAGRNAKSAAAALGVDRGTVAKRLRTIEQLVGAGPLHTRMAELEVAMRLEPLLEARDGAGDSIPGIAGSVVAPESSARGRRREPGARPHRESRAMYPLRGSTRTSE